MIKQEEIKEFLGRMDEPDVVRKVEFAPFDVPAGKDRMKVSINFIDDIPVVISVELGGATMKIKDILKLGEGSVVELEQPAGEVAEVLVNGQRFGRGEIVVIGSNFGVRMESIHQLDKNESMGKV